MVWAEFMSIVKFKVDTETGATQFISGWTKPMGATSKKPKAKPRKMDIGDIEEEIEL